MGGSCSKADPTLTKPDAFIVSDEGNFKEMTHIELARWLASKGFPEAGSHARSLKIRGGRIYSLWQENKAAEIISTLQLSEADQSWGKLRLELEIILGSYQGADVAALPPHLQADLNRKKSRRGVSQSVKGGTAGGADEVVILGPDGTLVKVPRGSRAQPEEEERKAEAAATVEEATAAPAQEGTAAEAEAAPTPEAAEAVPAEEAAAAEPAPEAAAAEAPAEAAEEQPPANE